MMRLSMSPAASALLRALLARAGVSRDRILLSEWRSEDWQSLTFVGERHECELRISGSDAADVAARLIEGLSENEFAIPGHVVADILVIGKPAVQVDGAVYLRIEALTIADGSAQ